MCALRVEWRRELQDEYSPNPLPLMVSLNFIMYIGSLLPRFHNVGGRQRSGPLQQTFHESGFNPTINRLLVCLIQRRRTCFALPCTIFEWSTASIELNQILQGISSCLTTCLIENVNGQANPPGPRVLTHGIVPARVSRLKKSVGR